MCEHGPANGLSTDEALGALKQILLSSSCDEEELRKTIAKNPELQEIGETLFTIRKSCTGLANGDLNVACKGQGFTIGNIKSLMSNLRYLAWQLRRLAMGDNAAIDPFLGEFSQAFTDLHKRLNEKTQQLNLLIDKYKNLAQTDALTKLANRRAFFDMAVRELVSARRHGGTLTLLMFDVDFFKRVNDTYGHTAGDSVLKNVAKRANEVMRAEDFCARYGGEEFIVLLRDTDVPTGCRVAERLRAKCNAIPIEFEGTPIHVTISLGVAALAVEELAYLPPARTLEASLERVDTAMYAAKTNGRNRVYYYNGEDDIRPYGTPGAPL